LDEWGSKVNTIYSTTYDTVEER